MVFSKKEARKHARAIIKRMKELQKDTDLKYKMWGELEEWTGDLREYAKFALKQSIKENEQVQKRSGQRKKDS